MSRPYSLAIVGAGAAGMSAALEASRLGCRDLILLEGGQTPGK